MMASQHGYGDGRRGVSLVEVLIVIAVIGLLVALMLPAIMRVRETASRAQCANNLREIGTGLHNHNSVARAFPSGGWGWNWIGIADRGSNSAQPGGWLFSLLPYIEQESLYSEFQQGSSNIAEALARPIPVYNCPSRRTGGPYSNRRTYYFPTSTTTGEILLPAQVARSDYAGNGGSQHKGQWKPGPRSLAEGASPIFRWPTFFEFTGMFVPHVPVRLEHVTRGVSNTFLAGERFLNTDVYATGTERGDNECQFSGYDNDTIRTTYNPPLLDASGRRYPNRFGSAHPDGLNMLYADCSVRSVTYDVDPTVYRLEGKRDQ